ncbi:tRNA (adenosine(37)-N6)-threonylcarbamoyltransferase complex dimerization subunit type 1 TsaB [Spiroplasma citri]|uniref:tRNA (Adenosine(37)-N6)-threonylcarbamoyltransferase complex dimerization subunit type 1 TsaB n=1 Tax=Spiroplasma citri TaxID=2133 RepID=A0AAJ4EK72_SPICI|nr:tRNA (adenosine(37)-N6)-threonylcarbamoyltransferase complex dimerization subunit type 1 TsaB [Spiroplasma citri]APE75149.1 glycoprotease [Spiroplasma citri]QED25072.1 tRNA (adenosine(37)-N6)-threonylcarbamoyltransferase complex dimerization subunit type 1 TsaB [Spiroplasma citri]QIA67405.1 tRNA (adenosine(37)-N6)-threonylcarbamoyltransferase complex dimerization subunit type 1 TsaB [Spiroplasma citri]QIA69258.1 tRNA (adenosine(37)-N6)-threonylcarbamoyltransferase complex dimerization subuni
MLNLFIDTSTDFLILILEQKQKIIGQVHENHTRRHTEATLPVIKQLLSAYQLKLKDINNFYLTTGPGSYTGVRIPMTIVKTIKIINSAINVYTINTLLYQAGLDNVVSMLDARVGKRYFAVISNGTEVIPGQVLDYETCIEITKQFPGYEFRYNLQEIDFVQNYLVLKDHFKLVTDIFALEPQYLKKDWS